MFEEAIRLAQTRIRASETLSITYRQPERDFWQHVLTCCKKGESDVRRPKCKKANKVVYGSEEVARIAAQYGAELDTGSRVWDVYTCVGCSGWHVGHGWQTRTTDALPITEGYTYPARIDLRFSVDSNEPLSIRHYREQLSAALRNHLEEYSFDVEGDYTPRCLWPRIVRLRVAPDKIPQVCAIECLRVGSVQLRLSEPRLQALEPRARVFSRLVTAKHSLEPQALGQFLTKRLATWGGSAVIAIGERKVVEVAGSTIVGFEVEVSKMDARTSVILQAEGLGGRIRYGCGFFLST